MSEIKRNRFIRIAESRTIKIIDMIQLLSNCANRNNYDFNEKDIIKIFSTIEKELKNAKQKFSTNNKQTKFQLEK